jgi:hypothetical protein
VSVIKDQTDCILSLVYVYTTHIHKGLMVSLCVTCSADAPHMLAGVKYRPREQQPVRAPGWRRGKRDEYTGAIIEPIEGTDIREGSVRSGRCSLEHLLQHAGSLVIGQVFESGGPIQLEGKYQTIPLDAEAQARPRLLLSTTPPWCNRSASSSRNRSAGWR